MTISKLAQELGFYQPSFFYLKVNTDVDLNSIENSEEEPVMIHELVHFLQDVTTTYGVSNLLANIGYIDSVINTIKEKKDNCITRPVKINQSTTDAINKDLFNLYFGDSSEKNIVNTCYLKGINIKPFNLINGCEDVEEIVLIFKNKYTGQSFKYNFGACHLLEYIAINIEQYLFDNIHKSPDLPYRAVDYVVNYIYKDFGDKKENVISLCDVSLMFFHPGWIFLKVLEKMRQESFMPNSFIDNYIYVLESTKEENCFELYEKESREAEENIKFLFPYTGFDDAGKWGKEKIKIARKIRLENRYLFPELILLDRVESKNRLIDLTLEIGLPLMFNSKDYGWFYNKHEINAGMPTIYRAIPEVFEVLLNPYKNNCTMKLFCESSDKKVVSNYCDDRPWENVHDGYHCSFETIWLIWGLRNKKVI